MADDDPSENRQTLSVRSVSKSFPGVRALSAVDLEVRAGTVVAVVGENGAGKSTLMKILAGVQTPDSGTIKIDDQVCQFSSTRQALQAGISLIHQELNLCDNLSVAENLFLGNQPHRLGIVRFGELNRLAAGYLKRVGLAVSPKTQVSSLAIGQQQLVEIAKALSVEARFIIFDEPTSSLSEAETQTLFQLIHELRRAGVGIVYISHRLHEVMELADHVTVLRDGQNAGELSGDQIQRKKIVSLMIGRQQNTLYDRPEKTVGEPLLCVKDLITCTWPQHKLNFQVCEGELVGLAGLVGAGRSELLRALFGMDPMVGGLVEFRDKIFTKIKPSIAIASGMGLVPEDRKQQGLFVENSVQRNIGIAGLLRNRLWGGFLNRSKEISDSRQAVKDLAIKTPTLGQPVGFLSGGNQQKVVMAKWLALDPKLLMLDEPTRGVDVGARQEIYQMMQGLAAEGRAVLFASSDLEEVIGLADRVLVMHEGRIAGELTGESINQQEIMTLATGS